MKSFLQPFQIPPLLFYDRQYIIFFHKNMLDTVKPDIRAGILGKKNPLSCLDLQRNAFAVFSPLAGSGSNDLAPLRFFFGRIRNDDSAGIFSFLFLPDDQYPVIYRSDINLC
jgi:hypothetical protein